MNGEFATAAEQENRGPSPNCDKPDPIHPIEWWIQRVMDVIPESAQTGTEPLSTKASVLAQLYQAQFLQNQARSLRTIAENGEQILEAIRTLTDAVDSLPPLLRLPDHPNEIKLPRFGRNPERKYRLRRRRRSIADIFRDMADHFEDVE